MTLCVNSSQATDVYVALIHRSYGLYKNVQPFKSLYKSNICMCMCI